MIINRQFTNFIYILIILFNSSILVRSQIEFKIPNEFDKPNGLNRYPTQTNTDYCQYDIPLFVIQSNGGDGSMAMDISDGLYPSSYNMATSNSTHFLYGLSYYSDLAISTIHVNVTGNGVKADFDIVVQCLDYNINSIGIEFMGEGKIYFDPIYSYIVPIQFTGLPQYSQPFAQVDGLPSGVKRDFGDCGFLMINYYSMYSQAFTGLLKVDFDFGGGQIISKSIQHYFNESFNEEILINSYPSDFSRVNLIGKLLYPIISIETTTVAKNIFFTFTLNGGSGYSFQINPIYESNGKTTYLASPLNTVLPIYNLPTISFYAQNKSITYQALNKPNALIIDLPITQVVTSDFSTAFSNSNIVPRLRLSYSNTAYHLNKFLFTIGNNRIDLEAPFGFVSGSNSDYQYAVSHSFSPYSPELYYSVGINYGSLIYVPGNTNTPDKNSPLLESYSFTSLGNSSKYLFNARIIDQGCGTAFISLDSLIYKRASQYRVSGDQYDGNYEIPIDFDLDIYFQRLTTLDYCGLASQYNDGLYVEQVPFKMFTVPFLKYDYNLYTIKDISFLYNNLDVRKESVGNSIYFTLEGADPLTPFSFRLPIVDGYDSSGYFSHEYYGFWNSLINKFQIDFVVPKNSRLGPFKFSIAYGYVKTVSSDFFSSSSQLIISKSNFDGIGPIFSRVDRVPFSGGKFGWHLTISDPINGFDNGTITVMGSQDNSIYKFNLFPIDATSGDSKEGVYEILIDLGSRYCINQDYIITFVKLWDTGAQYTVFELVNQFTTQQPNQIANPFYLFFNDSTINKNTIDQCNDATLDTTPPVIDAFYLHNTTIDVGASNRVISFQLHVKDPESGININAQGPIIYITGENVDIVQCITKYDQDQSTSIGVSIFICSIELPVGFSSSYKLAYFSVYGILNNHGLYGGYDSQLLEDSSFTSSIPITFTKNEPVLIDSGKASSRGGQYFVYGRGFVDIESLDIIDTVSKSSVKYSSFNIYGSTIISISNLAPTTNDFYVMVTSKSGVASNRLLVSPVLFNDYNPSQDSSSGNQEPLPTNAPQQCFGNPICGGPTHGTCNNQTGCVCIYPWRGKSCQDKVSEPSKPPIVDPNEPSTGIEIPDDKDDQGNPINNIHYQSLISLHSLREVDINGKAIKNYPFNNKWQFDQYSDLKSNYQINVTTGANGFNTTISATLEWFNQTKVITFADQDLEMYANSIKYSIEISNYPFSSSLTYLQLVMSATITSTSSDSCSSKDFGDTTSGDNSNYVNIQIDNKSLYGRFIKRGIIDEDRVVSISNERLDSALNAISKASQTQTYIGIAIPQYNKRALIDPDFSVLISSNSATSVCKSKGLSGGKIAGIVIGATAFAAVIAVSVIYHFKKKRDAQKFKTNITNKLSQMNSTSTA